MTSAGFSSVASRERTTLTKWRGGDFGLVVPGTIAQPTGGPVRQTREDREPSRLSKDVDRCHSRRVALAWLCSLQAAASVVGGVVTFAHKPHDWVVLAGIAQYDTIGVTLANILHVAVVVTAGIILLSYSDGLNFVLTGGVALFLAISVADGSNPNSRLLAFAYLAAVCLALLALRPTTEDLKVVGGVGLVIALIALFFALFFPETAFMPAGWNQKLFPSLPSLAGPLNHSNSLGVLLALSAPFTLLFRRTWLKWTSLLLIAGVIVLSASRTALLALGAAIAVFLICALWRGISRLTAGLSLVIAGALVVTVPLTTQDADAYSGRGVVWAWALGQFHTAGQYIWGASSAWPSIPTRRGSEGAPAFSAHNLFVQWLFVGGLMLVVLGVALFVAYARRVLRMLPGTLPLIAIVYLLILLVSSVFEFIVVLTPGSPFFVVTVVPLVSVLAQPRQVRHAPE
jgi:hypothetical protein